MNKNVMLAIAAAVLLVISIVSYSSSVSRAERFEKGQKFLPNLNPDEITEIEITKGETLTHLKRAGDTYVVTSRQDYPAKNESVNRFITDLLDLELAKEVGSGESLEKELEVAPGGESTIEVKLNKASGKEMVHLTIGKSLEGASGQYVKRLDGDNHSIFLSSRRLNINTDESNFLKKQLVNVSQEDIAKIQGPDFAVNNVDGTLKLQSIPSGKTEKSGEVSQIKSAFSYLNFDQVFLADAGEVTGLRFQPSLTVDLKNETGYRLHVAQKGDDVFAKIEAFHQIDVQANASITRDSPEEELKEKSEKLSLVDETKKFNQLHGSWVYQLSEHTAKKFQKTKKDLLEDEKSDG